MHRLILSTLLLFTLFAPAQTLDQSQLNSNAGTSARTLPGYSIAQSFKCGITGTLSKIDVGFFSTMNGQGTLKIYAGNGISGTVLQTLAVTATCGAGDCFISFTTNVAVQANQTYTFQFTPGTGMPDPYGVQVQMPGTYANGTFYIIDPSGVYDSGFDMVFRTYVTAALGVDSNQIANASISPNPFNNETLIRLNTPLSNGTLCVYDVFGKKIREVLNLNGIVIEFKKETLSAGIYLFEIHDNNQQFQTKRVIVTN
ncbi:MAG: Secretion system C-terminal sorting domain [Bacteroidota bacterium]|jgi:hypothetical protein